MKNSRSLNSIIGLALTGSLLTGLVGFIAGLIALLAGEPIAAGTCLISAALAFGLLINAILRR